MGNQLVYLFAPSVVLDETHYILSYIQGQILCGVYHVRRLKKA